jgi:ABC-type glutathione transport system ATPase component
MTVPEAAAVASSASAEARPLLELRDVSVTYSRGGRHFTAVDGVSLTVAPNEIVGVVGESGAGKSTLGRAVLGLAPVAAGTVYFDGTDITRRGHGQARSRRLTVAARLQAVFQDPNGSLNPARTVRSSLAEPLVAQGRPRAEVTSRVETMLDLVGLNAAAADRYPRQFSGGQRQRIAIARALMVSPSLVICDEPLTALDLSVQAQIINLLLRLRRELGLSYLFISHDMAAIRHLADRVAVLRGGRLVECGPTAQVCSQPADPYTKALMDAAPVPQPARERERLTARARALGGPASAGRPREDPAQENRAKEDPVRGEQARGQQARGEQP